MFDIFIALQNNVFIFFPRVSNTVITVQHRPRSEWDIFHYVFPAPGVQSIVISNNQGILMSSFHLSDPV